MKVSILLPIITLSLLFIQIHTVFGQDDKGVRNQLDSIQKKLKRLEYKIDSSSKSIREDRIESGRSKNNSGLLGKFKSKGVNNHSASNPSLVTRSWLGTYLKGSFAESNSAKDLLGVGFGITLTNMLLKPVSWTAFVDFTTLQGYFLLEKKPDYTENQINAGAILNIYPHTLWGGMPKNIFILNGGIQAGLRYLDPRYINYFPRPVDKNLSILWGLEIMRPIGDVQAFKGGGSVAFLSFAINIISPIEKFGDLSGVNVKLAINGNPFTKKKIIGPYYHNL